MDESIREEFRQAHARLRTAHEAYDELYLTTLPYAGQTSPKGAAEAEKEIRDARAALRALRNRHGIPDPTDYLVQPAD